MGRGNIRNLLNGSCNHRWGYILQHEKGKPRCIVNRHRFRSGRNGCVKQTAENWKVVNNCEAWMNQDDRKSFWRIFAVLGSYLHWHTQNHDRIAVHNYSLNTGLTNSWRWRGAIPDLKRLPVWYNQHDIWIFPLFLIYHPFYYALRHSIKSTGLQRYFLSLPDYH